MSEVLTPDAPLPQREPQPPPGLTDKERQSLQRSLGFPLDLPGDFKSYIIELIRLELSADNILGLAPRLATVGQIKIIAKDLTAETGVYVWTDAQGDWLYMNGADFGTGNYPELEAFLGTTVLADTRGRSIWMCGTNAATDLGDNDGVAEASRQPKHTHSAASLTVTGAPSHTLTLPNHVHSVTDPGHTHPIYYQNPVAGSALALRNDVTRTNQSNEALSATTGISIGNPTSNPSISGSITAGTLGVSGTAGSGMSGSDAVAHIVIGSALIKV